MANCSRTSGPPRARAVAVLLEEDQQPRADGVHGVGVAFFGDAHPAPAFPAELDQRVVDVGGVGAVGDVGDAARPGMEIRVFNPNGGQRSGAGDVKLNMVQK